MYLMAGGVYDGVIFDFQPSLSACVCVVRVFFFFQIDLALAAAMHTTRRHEAARA